MKQNFLLCVFVILLFSCSSRVYCQSLGQRENILSTYDLNHLSDLSKDFSVRFSQEFRRAEVYVRHRKIPITLRKANGGIAVLQKVLSDGTLIYLGTHNRGAGTTVGADKLYPSNDSGLGLKLEGSGFHIGVWDGGKILSSHELLGIDRVTNNDRGAQLNSHATHVTGTIIGSESVAGGLARGIAYKAEVSAFDFVNDLSEMAKEASKGMILSNHSYGYVSDDLPTYYFGRYDEKARGLDDLLYYAPYYTVVSSAGNDRNANPPLDPGNSGDAGYDLLTDMAVAKNNIVVAAVHEVKAYKGPSSVKISDFSSFGPTDDGRIKPDISAKGVGTYSSTSDSNFSYEKYSGTSMAAPNVTGGLALLQELQSNITGSFLKASTLKALVIHTASEAGNHPGPDYQFGWGLLNVEAAAKVILKKDFQSLIEENTLNQGASYTKQITALGSEPLVVTVVWTDPKGPLQPDNEAALDDPTPRLVNDLDVVLIDQKNNKSYPWKLDANAYRSKATKGINNVDNVEKIEIDAPAGNYTIKITHKGTLQNGAQNYSLVVSGIEKSLFTFTPDSKHKDFCSDEIGSFQFNFQAKSGFNGPTLLSVDGLPSGANAAFTPATITSPQNFKLNISGLANVIPSTYTINIKATSNGTTRNQELTFKVESSSPIPSTTLLSPSNAETDVFILPKLKWSPVPGATKYKVQVSKTSNFSSINFDTNTSDTNLLVSGLESNTKYFWRVQPFTGCYEAAYRNGSFTTETLSCSGKTIAAKDLPKTIPVESSVITSVINIPDDVNIGDVNVHVTLSHSYLSDIRMSLISPSGKEIVLMDGACGDGKDVKVIFDDSGLEFSCGSFPAVSGVKRPFSPLSQFIGESSKGNWTLKVQDFYDDEGGSLSNFGLTICSTNKSLSVIKNEIDGFNIYPNPANKQFEFSLLNQQDIVILDIYDINGRQLIGKFFSLNDQKLVDITKLFPGIYFVEIKNGNQRGTKKLIVR